MSRLTRDDWSTAALGALATGGVAAVAIEPLAASLGTTKGSFYWHFRARSELVESALALWEQRSTADVIKQVEGTGGAPEARLRLLFSLAFDPQSLTGVDVRLLTHTDDEPVRDVLRRVTRRRVDYIARLLRETGLPTHRARRRAMLAYGAFLGTLQLMHADEQMVRSGVGSLSSYADEVVQLLVRG